VIPAAFIFVGAILYRRRGGPISAMQGGALTGVAIFTLLVVNGIEHSDHSWELFLGAVIWGIVAAAALAWLLSRIGYGAD
jgi:Na+/melibiose symporter-like transporter